MFRFVSLARIAFWSAAFLALVMALLPQPPQLPLQASDKFQHVLAFSVLAGLATLAYPKIPPLRIGIALSAFGAAIEFFQLVPALHRDAQLSDWIVDTAAIFAVLAVVAARRRGGKAAR